MVLLQANWLIATDSLTSSWGNPLIRLRTSSHQTPLTNPIRRPILLKICRFPFPNALSLSQRFLLDPRPTINLFFDDSFCQLRNHVAALEPLQEHIIRRPAEINQTIPSAAGLQTWWRYNAMDIWPQKAIGEFYHCITQIDYTMAWQRTHIMPDCCLAWKLDLEAAEAVEKEGDATKVGVFSQRGF